MSVEIHSSGALVSSGDVITSAVLAEGGNDSMWVLNGGTANSTTVNSGGMYVLSGGTANNTTMNTGGDLDVYSGGTANNTTVNSGGWMYVDDGGTALQIKENGGYVYVEEGANVTFLENTFSNLVLNTFATVHSGTTAINTTVNSWGSMYVSSGGTASNITASSGAYLGFVVAPDTYIQGTSNGSAFEIKDSKVDNYTIDRGYLHVESGGTANNTTVNSSGWMSVSSGGTANSTTVNNWGSMYVSSGGTANNTTVYYGDLYVDDGGTVNNTTVNDVGYMYVSSGGTANNTTVNIYGSMYVSSGGTANNITVNRGGDLYVSSGGVASNTTIKQGGTINGFTLQEDNFYESVVHISNAIVNSYCNAYLYSGQIANNTTVNNWSYLYVDDGGTASNTTIKQGGTINGFTLQEDNFYESGVHISNAIVSSDSYANLYSGQTANSTTVNSGGAIYVSSGGIATQIKENGGYVYVADGANVTFLENNFSNLVLNTSATVHSGTTANNTTLNGGGAMYVFGGTANSTTVKNGGGLYVSNGGNANIVTVSNMGNLYVSSGGVASSVVVTGGGFLNIHPGGKIKDVTLQGDEDNLVTMGVFEGNVISAVIRYGSMDLHGGSAQNVDVVKGGEVNVNYSDLTSATISQGGLVTVRETGVVNSVNIINDGYLYVSSGGTATNTTINSRGSMYVSNGGIANKTTVNRGGYLYVNNGGTATIAFNPWQGSISSETGATIEYLERDKNIYYGGYESGLILKADEVNDLQITSGNSAIIYSGGTATNITAEEGARLNFTVDPNTYIKGTSAGSAFEVKDGKLNNYTLDLDTLAVLAGGAASNIVVNNGGLMDVKSGGAVTDITVNDWGFLIVSSGAYASNVTINDGGGYQFIIAADTYIQGTIKDSEFELKDGQLNSIVNTGELYIKNGGVARNTVNYGFIYLEEGGKHRGRLELYNPTNVTTVLNVLEGGIIDFTVSEMDSSDDYLVNDLSLIGDTPTYTITVDANQETGLYKLAQGAENFTGTLSIGTETENYGTITVNGDILVRNDLSYKLVQDNGDLTLGIYRFADISRVTANTVYPTQKLYLFATFNEHSAQKLYSYDQKTWFEYGKNVLVEDNVTVYFKALNGNGVESEIKSYTVTNIDKTPPTLTISGNPTEWTNQGITLNVIANDENGISRIEYSEDSGATWKTWSSRYMESGNFLFRAVDTVGNISEVSEVVVDKIDTIQPTLKGLKGLPSTWTNQDTFVTIIAEDNLSGIAKVEYRFWNEQEFTEGSSFVLDKNHYGAVTVRVTDKAGNVTERIYHDAGLGFVDQIAPSIEITPLADLETWRNDAVRLMVYTIDDESSIKEAKYRFSYEDTDTWHTIGSQVVVTQNCTVYFQLEDKAGNITNEEITINCIDNNIPAFTVTQSPHELTNESVTITINAEDDLSGIKSVEYSFNQSEWFEGNSFTMDRNGVYWVRVSDNAGNISVARRYTVTNIDKIAPKINKITETAIGNGILFNGDFEDNVGIAKVQYRVNSGEYLDYNSNGIFLSYNANIKFKITDLAGNVCEEVYKIANCRELNTFASWDGNNYGDSYRLKIYSQNSAANKGFEIIGTKFECLTSFKNVEYVVYNQDNKQIHKGSVIGDDVINGSYLRASADGIKEVFLARTNGVWGSLMRAEYQGSAAVEEKVILKGKNKICDIFVGSSDNNILFLTNDQNGDALFIDDIYSASFDNFGESNSRLAQIKEIQAGDGDDIIDLTSAKFDYSG
ncbi:MAG: AIDA repeat-containing protein, partial [Lentisphaeria bacterium]|nr:AIDA repeat-containing protein [Lentisphaeria bacterium]